MGVPLKGAVYFPQGYNLPVVIKTNPGQGCIDSRRLMTGGEEDPVTALPFGVGRINPGLVQVKGCGDIHYGEGSPRMPGAGGMDADDIQGPHFTGDLDQLMLRIPSFYTCF
ncbi:hypothetical protein ES703_119961 [subsurface metagenome]